MSNLELVPPPNRILVRPILDAIETTLLVPAAYKNQFEIIVIGDDVHSPFESGDFVALNMNVEELSGAGHVAHSIGEFQGVHSIPLEAIAFSIKLL